MIVFCKTRSLFARYIVNTIPICYFVNVISISLLTIQWKGGKQNGKKKILSYVNGSSGTYYNKYWYWNGEEPAGGDD